MRRFFCLVAAFVLLAAGFAPAQSQPCNAPAYHEFDFWLGAWVVTGAAGDTLGFNVITRVADGCALREEWTGRGGATGTSLTYFDPRDRQWRQDWVGSTGTILHLTGGLEDSTMVLEGHRISRQGPLRDSIRWTPLADGRVQQIWRTSRDEGATWQLLFKGIYQREDATAAR